MVTLLTGENSYAINQDINQMVDAFGGVVERFDGLNLKVTDLLDLLMGVSLFSEKRLVIIRDLSQNRQVWDAAADWIDKVSDDITLVLIEPKPDKRLRAFKSIHKVAEVREYKAWSLKDVRIAEDWVRNLSVKLNMELSPSIIRMLVSRVGVNQWQLSSALDKLSVLDEVSEETIKDVIDAQPSENIFDLFETALKGQAERVRDMVATLELTEDPYQVFGLLSGQVFQFVAVCVAKNEDDVSRDIGVHPFVLSRLKKYAPQRGVGGAKSIVKIFAESDIALKTSSVDPWLIIEKSLLQIASK